MESRSSNNKDMPKALIFGAGQSGLSAFNNLRGENCILGFVDNSANKQGTSFCELPVYAPTELEALQFDIIYIASEYIENIEKQLLNDCKLASEKIRTLPSYMTKPMQFGTQSRNEQAGHRVLTWLCGVLNQADVHYFLDAGTLLGVIRDGALIPWDDDLDIGIPRHELENVKSVLGSTLSQLEALTGYPWVMVELINQKQYGAINVGDVRSLKLSCQQEGVAFPMVDLFVKYPNGEQMDYALASRGISMSVNFIQGTEWTLFNNVKMKIPSSPESYLEEYYGDWQTPRKDWDVGMIKSARAF